MRTKYIFTILTAVLLILQAAGENRALLVGIGDYDTYATGWAKIHGNNDVDLLAEKFAAKNFSVSKLVDDKATKADIIKILKTLVDKTEAGDTVYVHFSGHGQLFGDMNNDEADGFDQSFVCYDAGIAPNFSADGKMYYGQKHLIDDELYPILNRLKMNVDTRGCVIVVFDACYSGGADRGETESLNIDDGVAEWVEFTRGTSDEFKLNDRVKRYLRSLKPPGRYSKGGAILIISACARDKKNYECRSKQSGKIYGSLSYCISWMLDDDIPLADWMRFFNERKYKSYKIFPPTQHPVIEFYK